VDQPGAWSGRTVVAFGLSPCSRLGRRTEVGSEAACGERQTAWVSEGCRALSLTFLVRCLPWGCLLAVGSVGRWLGGMSRDIYQMPEVRGQESEGER